MRHAKKGRAPPRHHKQAATHLYLLYFSMISLMFFYLKQRQAFKKPLEVSPNHFQMEIWQIKSLLPVYHVRVTASCHHIADSLLFASL
jgi:hypothetical protein